MGSLAVKYRPKTFSEVVGQDEVKTILTNQIKNNTIKNAYLFCGGSGVGKTTNARIFAKDINGEDGVILDLDCASNNGVDEVRNIIKETKTKPMSGKYKVFILDEAHSLTVQSNNALLKVLEEPPSTNIFILCTTNPEKMLETIRTRVQMFRFKQLTNAQIISRLKIICESEKINADENCLNMMAVKAKGSMRQAIQYLEMCNDYGEITKESVEQCLGIGDYIVHNNLLWAIYSKDIMQCTKIFEYNQDNVLDFIRQFERYLIQIIKYTISNNQDSIEIPLTDGIKEASEKIILQNQIAMLSFIKTLVESLAYNLYPLQTVETILLTKFGGNENV